VLGAGGAVFLATLMLSNGVARRIVVAAAEREARNEAEAATTSIDLALQLVEVGTRTLATSIEALQPDEAGALRLLQAHVGERPRLYGSALALRAEPGQPWPRAPYVRRDGEALALDDLSKPSYRYWERDWFTKPLASGKPGWSEPYFDESGGNAWMVTYSAPLYRMGAGGREIAGVVTADLSLDVVDEVVSAIRVGRTGYGLIVSAGGRVVSHPDPKVARAGRVAEPRPRAEVEPILRDMRAGGSAFLPIDDLWLGTRARVAYGPIPRTGWSLAVVYPESELLEDVEALFRRQAALVGIGLLLLAAVVVLLSRRLTRPLGALAAGAARMATGDLETPLPEPGSRDEVGTLAASFLNMRDSLRRYVADLRETTAAKERLESEVRVAGRIQQAMLPSATASGQGYELQAHLKPARGVGGDLYDHFVADGRLFFLVGDVSGKGVPAALFMARSKALFGTISARQSSPGRILDELNRALCAENDAGMFVTVVCGALDPVTGVLVCASGGHDAPLLVRADGTLRTPPIEGGSLLGLIDGGEFPETRLQLAPGEALVAFSDGVSEALDPSEQLFTIERLAAALAGRPHASAKQVCDTVLEAVEAFVAGAPQSDDLTLLVLRRADTAAAPAGSPGEVRIEVAPRLEAIPDALARLAAWLSAAGVTAAPAADLRLVSEELLSNAVRHGGARSPMLLHAVREAALVRLELRDDCPAFDPLAAPAPGERPAGEPGGWGLALVRELMDEASYAREGDRNVVRLGRRLDT